MAEFTGRGRTSDYGLNRVAGACISGVGSAVASSNNRRRFDSAWTGLRRSRFGPRSQLAGSDNGRIQALSSPKLRGRDPREEDRRHDPEPPKADFPLLGFDNVLLTPHMAARTYTAIENMSWVVRDVMEVLNGGVAKYPVP
jgi:hypothetical protein